MAPDFPSVRPSMVLVLGVHREPVIRSLLSRILGHNGFAVSAVGGVVRGS
jgi:hypothetical protein